VLKQYFEYFYKLKSLKEKRAIFKSPLSLYANRYLQAEKTTLNDRRIKNRL
jgi:uncharacterized protein YlxP (DUF503 family)